MAKEGERSAPADKGKGKVDDVKDIPGGKNDKPEDKTQPDGKQKDDGPEEGKSLLRCQTGIFKNPFSSPVAKCCLTIYFFFLQRNLVKKINS